MVPVLFLNLMTISSIESKCASVTGSSLHRCSLGFRNGFLPIAAAVITGAFSVDRLLADEPGKPEQSAADRIQALTPKLESYVADGMKSFDVPGAAIGMVAGDKAGKLNVLRLSLEDGQAYEFHRE